MLVYIIKTYNTIDTLTFTIIRGYNRVFNYITFDNMIEKLIVSITKTLKHYIMILIVIGYSLTTLFIANSTTMHYKLSILYQLVAAVLTEHASSTDVATQYTSC